MQITMCSKVALGYRSGSQRARVVTESWAEDNLYCPNCSSPKLSRLRNNTKVGDFSCAKCGFWYQLKGQKTRIGNQVSDGAFAAMIEAIRNDETPNFYFMHYDLESWQIQNLLLIPSFAFSESAIIKRNPLSSTARRAGWIGCNISLNNIPAEARIFVIKNCQIIAANEVRHKFLRIKPLKDIAAEQRGWTLDVLNAIRSLGKNEFTTDDAYKVVPALERLHPENRHVRAKIRQQLQILRDSELLIHVERGHWLLPLL